MAPLSALGWIKVISSAGLDDRSRDLFRKVHNSSVYTTWNLVFDITSGSIKDMSKVVFGAQGLSTSTELVFMQRVSWQCALQHGRRPAHRCLQVSWTSHRI